MCNKQIIIAIIAMEVVFILRIIIDRFIHLLMVNKFSLRQINVLVFKFKRVNNSPIGVLLNHLHGFEGLKDTPAYGQRGLAEMAGCSSAATAACKNTEQWDLYSCQRVVCNTHAST